MHLKFNRILRCRKGFFTQQFGADAALFKLFLSFFWQKFESQVTGLLGFSEGGGTVGGRGFLKASGSGDRLSWHGRSGAGGGQSDGRGAWWGAAHSLSGDVAVLDHWLRRRWIGRRAKRLRRDAGIFTDDAVFSGTAG